MQSGEYCQVTAIASHYTQQDHESGRRTGPPDKAYSSSRICWRTRRLMRFTPSCRPSSRPLVHQGSGGQQARAVRKAHRALFAGGSNPSVQMLQTASRLKAMERVRVSPSSPVAPSPAIGDMQTVRPSSRTTTPTRVTSGSGAPLGGGGADGYRLLRRVAVALYLELSLQKVFAILECDPKFKTDRLASAILDFGSGTSTFLLLRGSLPASRRPWERE